MCVCVRVFIVTSSSLSMCIAFCCVHDMISLIQVYARAIPSCGGEDKLLRLTHNHLVPVLGRGLVPAENILAGMRVHVSCGSMLREAVVTRVEHTESAPFIPLYNAHTLPQLMVVDGVVVSCATAQMPLHVLGGDSLLGLMLVPQYVLMSLIRFFFPSSPSLLASGASS